MLQMLDDDGVGGGMGEWMGGRAYELTNIPIDDRKLQGKFVIYTKTTENGLSETIRPSQSLFDKPKTGLSVEPACEVEVRQSVRKKARSDNIANNDRHSFNPLIFRNRPV